MSVDVGIIVREYIDKTVHMSLGTSTKDGKPWVCEVHFVYDDDLNLYFISKTATRHCQEIAENPHVAGNIVGQHSLEDAPNGIYFEGTAVALNQPSEKLVNKYCGRLKRDKKETLGLLEEGSRKMYKITVESWAAFGKFGDHPTGKHILKMEGQN